jgi:D-tyrosyl-tRNA(Tyr) deacylase
MRAVAQRVSSARVEVAGEIVGAIQSGLLVYLGAARDDEAPDIAYIVEKVTGLRVFHGSDGRMSRSVRDVDGGVLVVPQFTLFGDVRRGRRPSFDAAAPPDRALQLFEAAVAEFRRALARVETGRFRATMEVHCVVAGPVTIQLDSRKLY